MKITKLDRTATVEYHRIEDGELATIEAITMYGGVEIVSNGVTYGVRLDDTGALLVRVYGRAVEGLNISPRSSGEVRIWCEMWKPPAGE
jgi:hypothetical protein